MTIMRPVEDARSEAIRDLGLHPDHFALQSPEALAAALRQAGSYLCPAAPRRVMNAVARALEPLRMDVALDDLGQLLEEMTACGDFVEARTDGGPVQLYLGHPGFVLRRSGDAILFGIRPDGQPLLGEELSAMVEPAGHLRRLPSVLGHTLRDDLGAYGLVERDMESWTRSPVRVSATEYVAAHDQQLTRSIAADIIGLQVLDPTSPVGYYKGRWRLPRRSEHGTFVARRPQHYGADLWCYVRLEEGLVTHLVDLPRDPSNRGCDEAWRLQAAIDFARGAPQRVTVAEMKDGMRLLRFTSPIPRSQQRRLSILGEPTSATRALFAYELPRSEVEEEIHSLTQMLWLEVEVQ